MMKNINLKIKFHKLRSEKGGILNNPSNPNFLIISKGIIREIVFYEIGCPNDIKTHRINDFNFKITKLFKPIAESNYKIEFDFVHIDNNKVERINAYVNIPYWKYIFIKFTKGDYWITSKELLIGLVSSILTIIIDRVI